jgi:hypothetical protein
MATAPLDEITVYRIVAQLGKQIVRADSEELEARVEAMLEDPETVLYAAALCLGNQLGALGGARGEGEAGAAGEVEAAGLSEDE